MKFKLLFFIAAIVLSVSACTESDTAATISIAEGYITINPGETHDLDVDINVAAGTTVQFTTKDPNVATVSENGQVTAVGRGETLVTVRAGGATDYVVVRVLGDAVVAYDASDFLAAYDNGDYRIELRDDIVLSEVLEIDRALEIVFNGYTLTADFLVTQAFEGGIALNNELPIDDMMTLTDEDTRAFIGTIDLNGFYIKIFGNFIDLIDQETFNYIYTNSYEVGELTYDVYADYIEIGDAIPVSSIEDLLNVQSEEPYVFAAGTPYEKVVLRPYDHEEYVLVSDVKGSSTMAGERTAVVGEDDQVFVFNEDTLERSFINIESGGYRFFYENTLFYSDDYQNADFMLSDAINTYLTDNLVNISYTFKLYEYQYEQVDKTSTYLNNFTLDGQNFDIEYFEFEENDALFDEANGRINIFNVDFKDLVGSAKDSSEEGLIFEEIDADEVTFQNVEIRSNHYVVETEGEDNFGILAGYVNRASILKMNAMTIEYNTMYSIDGDDLAIVFGQLEETVAQISDIAMENNLIYQDDEDENIYDIGLFVGYMADATLQVNDYYSEYNLIDTQEGNDFGLFAGAIDDSTLYINDASFYEEKVVGEDNIGTIVGELIDSYLTGNRIDLDNLGFIGENTQGFAVGETDDSFVEFNEIEVYGSSMVGTYELGGFIGRMSTSSQLKINEFDLDASSIKGNYEVGGIVGDINSSILVALGGDIDESTFEGYFQIGGLIGDSNYSDITIIETYFYDMNFYVDYDAGTFIGESYYSDVFISDSEIYDTSFLNNIIDTENPGPMYDVGGAIGYAYKSNVVITRVDFELMNISGTYNIGGVVGRVNEGYLEVTLSEIDVYIEADSNIGGIVGYLDEAVLDVRNTDVALNASDLNEVIDLNRVGGLVGYARSSSMSVFNVYANAYVDEVVEKFGGLVGYLDDATLVASNSGAILYANESVVDIDLKDVGGLVGYAHTAQISLFKVYADTYVDGVIENFGGFIGYMYLTHMDALNVSVYIDVDFDSTREGFNADTFGEFVGYEDFGTIEIYYQDLEISSTDTAAVVTDLFTGKYVGTGTYETIIEVG